MPENAKSAPSGVETTPDAVQAAPPADDRVVHQVTVERQHLLLTQVLLQDQTDRYNELVDERRWLLHTSERTLALRGNLFVVEDTFTRSGRVFVKRAPLPHARPVSSQADLRVKPRKGSGFDFELLEFPEITEDAWTILDYEGGAAGRARVMQNWQRAQRPATSNHACPLFLSNTWGDRSRDGRITEDFLAAEIQAARRLGVDVLQIDDGWQRGTTANSTLAQERGGVWEGFWNNDPNFWAAHPERLPHGLEPIVAQTRAAGMRLGLWFAPDSWNEFANWRRDADCIVAFFRNLGIQFFKVDGVRATTDTAMRNLHRFFSAVLAESAGQVVFDLDVTAQIRPGYFGSLATGPLFVENRYSDWHNYWPHQTLRNLWNLVRWVDPRRLRMEFLNNARNTELYTDDPLAPARYRPDTLFATVMCANPLGWFEVSNLPEAYFEQVAPLVGVWKQHREALFSGTILPIGASPDGAAWTGFLSLDYKGKQAYGLVFRELASEAQGQFMLPGALASGGKWETLAGQGDIASDGATLRAQIDQPLGFVFARCKMA